MGRKAGAPNKLTTQVKEKLEELIDGIVNSIDIEELTTNQKIKMLQIALQYTLPRLQAMMIKEEQKEDEPIFIEVYERDKNKNEEVWKDNFNVTSTHTIKRKP